MSVAFDGLKIKVESFLHTLSKYTLSQCLVIAFQSQSKNIPKEHGHGNG